MNSKSLPLVIAVAAVALAVSAVSRVRSAPVVANTDALASIAVGARVTVTLRGDASGLAFSDRNTTGFHLTRSGRVQSIDSDWIVLQVIDSPKRTAIPLNAVAVIDTEAN